MACAATSPVVAPTPKGNPNTIPAQSSPATPPIRPTPPVAKPAVATAWSFTYMPGTYTYDIATSATIAPVSDSMNTREIPTLSQTATVMILPTGDVQIVNPAPPASPGCADPAAALITQVQGLIPKIPQQLTLGSAWRDSTVTSGCRGMIPATSTMISNYVVAGDTTTIDGSDVLQIQRVDSFSATGEGVDGQHRIQMIATGTGKTTLFFDVTAGRLTDAKTTQRTLVDVTTSGKLAQFIQHVTQSVSTAGHH